MKIRTKMLAGFLPVAALSVLAMTWFARRTVEQVLVQEVVRSGHALGLDLARDVSSGLAAGDEKTLLPLLQQVLDNAGALYAAAVDSTGRVVAHTDVSQRGRRYDRGAEASGHAVVDLDGRRAVEVTSPVRSGGRVPSGEEYLLLGQPQVEAGRFLGEVRIGLPLEAVLGTADRISRQVFWVITGVSGVSVVLLLFYSGLLLRPIRLLERATENIARGELGTVVDVSSRDEIGDLARSFNRMSGDLAATTVTLAEKEVLLKEIHHRVKNNLQIISSLLNLQQGQIRDPQASEVFNTSQARIMSMALVHEKLYQADDLALVEFSEYVEGLIGYLAQSYSLAEQRIALRAEVADVRLRIDEAIPCGLIVSELIVNAVKHAFPQGRAGEVVIGFRAHTDGRYALSVRDDGVGLPADFDLARAKSLGLRMIKILVQQLHGRLDIGGDGGAEFKIEFAARD